MSDLIAYAYIQWVFTGCFVLIFCRWGLGASAGIPLWKSALILHVWPLEFLGRILIARKQNQILRDLADQSLRGMLAVNQGRGLDNAAHKDSMLALLALQTGLPERELDLLWNEALKQAPRSPGVQLQ